ARSFTATPRRWNASVQSATAVNFADKSPTPECQSVSGARRQTARSTTTASGRPVGSDRRLPSSVKLACGEQKPSLETDVGTAKYGSPAKEAVHFATSNALPPPTPTNALHEEGTAPSKRTASSTLASCTSWTRAKAIPCSRRDWRATSRIECGRPSL